MMEIKPGQWVVTEDRFGGRFELRQVHKVSYSTFEYVEDGRVRRRGRSMIVFAGTWEAADACQSKLTKGYDEHRLRLQTQREMWEAVKAGIIQSARLTTAK